MFQKSFKNNGDANYWLYSRGFRRKGSIWVNQDTGSTTVITQKPRGGVLITVKGYI